MMPDQLARYLKAWDLSDPQPLAQTATSHVYTVRLEGAQVVLKLLTPLGVKDEVRGAIALRHFNGQGAVSLLREDEQAHLLEYADGPDLIPMVENGQDEAATAIIADVLIALHAPSTGPFPDGLTPLRVWFRDLFSKAEADRRNGLHSIYMRAAPVAETLLATPQDVRVLHGDMHHANIRHHAERGWLAFDPKGLLGERTFDAANSLCNPMDMPALVENESRLLKNAGILSHKLEIDLSRILTFVFAYACLSASWSLDDNDDPHHALRIAELVEPHIDG